jgi:glutamine amidotransferase
MGKMIAIVDYKAGNSRSVERALDKLGFSSHLTHDREEILGADRVIFPGVGAAGAAMEDLKRSGADRVLMDAFQSGMPFMGICVGAQVILDQSEEDQTVCLGMVAGRVIRFPEPLVDQDGERLKIPHIGWNGLRIVRAHPVLEGIRETDEFYFDHSYYTMPSQEACTIGTTDYGIDFPSVLAHRNLVATQFHPEKSGPPGLRILENFCRWEGRYVE